VLDEAPRRGSPQVGNEGQIQTRCLTGGARTRTTELEHEFTACQLLHPVVGRVGDARHATSRRAEDRNATPIPAPPSSVGLSDSRLMPLAEVQTYYTFVRKKCKGLERIRIMARGCNLG
jgi:hypothetical protein